MNNEQKIPFSQWFSENHGYNAILRANKEMDKYISEYATQFAASTSQWPTLEENTEAFHRWYTDQRAPLNIWLACIESLKRRVKLHEPSTPSAGVSKEGDLVEIAEIIKHNVYFDSPNSQYREPDIPFYDKAASKVMEYLASLPSNPKGEVEQKEGKP